MKTIKNYTLRKISKQECKRRGFFVYEIGNTNLLIALKHEHKTFKLKDPTTWGHLYAGGRAWGRFLKLRKNYKTAHIICEKPQEIKLEIKPVGPCVYTKEPQKGVYYRLVNNKTTYKHYSLKGIIQSNKNLFGHIIGTFIT